MRSFRHIRRCVGNLTPRKVLIFGHGSYYIGEVIAPSLSKDCILFFQDVHGGRALPNGLNITERQICEKLLKDKYSNCLAIYNQGLINQLGGYVVLLPEDFDERYETFVKQNRKILEKIFGRMCDKNDFFAIYTYALTEGSPNLFQWAMNNVFKHGASFHGVKNCINWCINYPQLIKNLSKGTPTAYNGKNAVIELYNEMVTLRKNKRVNDVINMFNTAQKKLLKNLELTTNIIDIFSKFYILSQAKKHNFVRKMSTVEDVNEIIRQMALLTKTHFDWNKESFMNYINNVDNINCEIVLNRDNIVVLKVHDYETIKYLAKTTNWCISKNKKYWNDYVGHRENECTQYVLFDFSKDEDDELSIVGFTISSRKGITNAHSFSNENLMNGVTRPSNVQQFVPLKPSIFTLLQEYNVPINNFIEKIELGYDWDEESYIEMLDEHIDDYDIIYNENNKMVIITSSPMARLIVGKSYENIIFNCNTSKCIIFTDFNKDASNTNRLLFVGVNWDSYSSEEIPSRVYNLNATDRPSITFDTLLQEYHLPYNVICRNEDKVDRFVNALLAYDAKLINTLLQDKNLVDTLLANVAVINSKCAFIDIILTSITSIYTLDILKALYNNGITLSMLTTPQKVDRLLSNLIYGLGTYGNGATMPPTEEEKKAVFMKNKFGFNKCKFIGNYLAIELILENEKNKSIIGNNTLDTINSLLHQRNLCIDLTNKIIGDICDKTHNLDYILQSIVATNNTYALAVILDSNIDAKYINYIANCLPKNHELYPMVEKAKKVKAC